MDRMQDMLDHWDDLLRATGGALEQQKRYWYLIAYTCRNGKWCYQSPSETPGKLLLYNDDTSTKEPIPRLSPHVAKLALGIFTCPSGSMLAEAAHLRSKAKTCPNSLTTKHVSQEDAWYSLTGTIMRTIEYPLVATSLTQTQCAEIMAPILTAGLHSIHIQKNLP